MSGLVKGKTHKQQVQVQPNTFYCLGVGGGPIWKTSSARLLRPPKIGVCCPTRYASRRVSTVAEQIVSSAIFASSGETARASPDTLGAPRRFLQLSNYRIFLFIALQQQRIEEKHTQFPAASSLYRLCVQQVKIKTTTNSVQQHSLHYKMLPSVICIDTPAAAGPRGPLSGPVQYIPPAPARLNVLHMEHSLVQNSPLSWKRLDCK